MVRKTYKKSNKNNKTKKMYGGNGFSLEESPIMLGIPVDKHMAIKITKYTGSKMDDIYINRYLRENNTDIRIQHIDGARGLCILGYNIINVSHINGPLNNSSSLLRELRQKNKTFKDDIKKLNPKLEKITLSLWEPEDEAEIDVEIKDLNPYLFEINSL
jgi:hypothetical protein